MEALNSGYDKDVHEWELAGSHGPKPKWAPMCTFGNLQRKTIVCLQQPGAVTSCQLTAVRAQVQVVWRRMDEPGLVGRCGLLRRQAHARHI